MTRDRSINRMLLLRVALAAVLVSVPAAAIVTYREHGR
jgi:hypothetical protein